MGFWFILLQVKFNFFIFSVYVSTSTILYVILFDKSSELLGIVFGNTFFDISFKERYAMWNWWPDQLTEFKFSIRDMWCNNIVFNFLYREFTFCWVDTCIWVYADVIKTEANMRLVIDISFSNVTDSIPSVNYMLNKPLVMYIF